MANSTIPVLNITDGVLGVGVITPTSSFKLETSGTIGPTVDSRFNLGAEDRKWDVVYGNTFTGDVSGTSSFSPNSLFSSRSFWATSASYASSSTALGLTAYNISVLQASQSRWATSASYASSSTFSENSRFNVSSSYASSSTFAVSANSANFATTAGSSTSSSYSLTSSFASSSIGSNLSLIQATSLNTIAYLTFALNTGSYQNTYVTTSITTNPSAGLITVNALSGSVFGKHIGDTIGTASWASASINSTFSVSSSFASSSYLSFLSDTASYVSGAIHGIIDSASYSFFSELSETSSYSEYSVTSLTSFYSSQSAWSVSSSYASSSTALGLTAYNISVLQASQSRWATSASYASSSNISNYSNLSKTSSYASSSNIAYQLQTPPGPGVFISASFNEFGTKYLNIGSSTYTTGLTVTLLASQSAYIRTNLAGWWPKTGSIGYLCEFFIQNDSGQNRPGMILRQDNNNGFGGVISSIITDPGPGSPGTYVIGFKSDTGNGATAISNSILIYDARGMFVSVT